MLQNNPLTIALSELYTTYPDISVPQFLINLGTGTPGQVPPNKEDRALFTNSFIFRLFRSYMSLLRSRRPWEEFCRSVKRSQILDRIFRLDITFKGSEPDLDDITTIPQLKDWVYADRVLSSSIDDLSRRMIASLFYFELELPAEQKYGTLGIGYILSLCKRPSPALDLLVKKLAGLSAAFVVDDAQGCECLQDSTFWDSKGDFKKYVNIKTDNDFSISLRIHGFPDYPISGSPFSISRLVKLQGLDAYFGTGNHKKRTTPIIEERRSKRRKLCSYSGPS